MLAHSCDGHTFLELGCGCALPSATLKQLSAGRVVATDGQPKLLDSLQLDDVETRHLGWASYNSLGECDEYFDVVIGAEILYAAPDIVPLSRILPNLAADRGLVLLVSLARRRPLLETLGRRLSDSFDVTYDNVVLTGSSPDAPALRVTVDDNPVVSLVVLQARRRASPQS